MIKNEIHQKLDKLRKCTRRLHEAEQREAGRMMRHFARMNRTHRKRLSKPIIHHQKPIVLESIIKTVPPSMLKRCGRWMRKLWGN